MTDQLQNSMRVKLNGFGSFKIGLKTSPANSAKEFKAANIKSMHVIFQPEATRSAGQKSYSRTFLDKAKIREAAFYDVDKEAAGVEGHAVDALDSEKQSAEANSQK